MSEPVKLDTISSATVRHWTRSPLLALCEFALVALIFWADIHHHIFLSKTLYLFPLAWISLRVRGFEWKDVGLVRYQNWKKTMSIGVACGVAMELLELFVSQPLLMRWTGRAPDLELFRALHGNVMWTFVAIAGSWTLAAFGEEMVYRGYLLNRMAAVLGSTKGAWIGGLVVSSLVFGASHLGQGITGQLENALDGLILGADLPSAQEQPGGANRGAWRHRHARCLAFICRTVSDLAMTAVAGVPSNG